MIVQVKIRLASQQKINISSDYAYNIYGCWMDVLKPEQADFLHEVHGINQYLVVNHDRPDSALLTVNILKQQVSDFMLPLLMNMKQYHITKHNCTLVLEELQVLEIDDDELTTPYFVSPQYRKRITLNLLVPTTFKTNGRYAIFPTPELIIRSAASKFNMLGLNTVADDEEAIRQLMESTMITGYRLYSTHYYLKDTRIQSFLGSLTLSIHGPEPMVRLFDMLMSVLRYTGLGIKTSLGMGGVDII